MSCGSKACTATFPLHGFETAERRPWYRRAFRVLSAAIKRERRLQLWLELEKARQRGLLENLDDQLFADLGLAREQAEQEAREHCWR